MGCSIPPWDLAAQPQIWGAWAKLYRQAKHDAAVMRDQIQAVRSKGQ